MEATRDRRCLFHIYLLALNTERRRSVDLFSKQTHTGYLTETQTGAPAARDGVPRLWAAREVCQGMRVREEDNLDGLGASRRPLAGLSENMFIPLISMGFRIWKQVHL